MKNNILFTLVFIFSFALTNVFGQRLKKKFKYTSIGWNINAMNYVGEVDPGPGLLSPGIKFTRQNFGICILKRISPRISGRLNFSRGLIKGSDVENASWSVKDINRKIRNLSFRNPIWELKADIVIDMFENRERPTKRVDYTPYLFTGIAYFYHNPQAKSPYQFGGHWVDLQPLALEGKHYSLHQISIPVGIGFRYKLNKRWDLAFEMGWRFTFTDYLDDVSNTYKDRAYFGDNELSAAMSDRTIEGLNNNASLERWVNENQGYQNSNGYITVNGYGKEGDQRGDPKDKDLYIITGFHFTYLVFPKVVNCVPKFRSTYF